jgi:GNAT superfamily N-acetyltransferase
VEVRPLEADDGDRLRRQFFRLSPMSVYLRFLSPLPAPSDAGISRLLDVDHCQREALAALDGDEIVAVARYAAAPRSGAAEIAVVSGDWQREGLGHLLLEHLARLARRCGILKFQATVLGDNTPALRLGPEPLPRLPGAVAHGSRGVRDTSQAGWFIIAVAARSK